MQAEGAIGRNECCREHAQDWHGHGPFFPTIPKPGSLRARFIACCAPESMRRALEALHAHRLDADATMESGRHRAALYCTASADQLGSWMSIAFARACASVNLVRKGGTRNSLLRPAVDGTLSHAQKIELLARFSAAAPQHSDRPPAGGHDVSEADGRDERPKVAGHLVEWRPGSRRSVDGRPGPAPLP